MAMRSSIVELFRVRPTILSAAGLAAAFAIAWVFVQQIRACALTVDWAWLYRAGRLIDHAHRLPATDPWSWTHPHLHWVLYQWLFEAGVAPIFHFLGPAYTVAALSALALAIYIVVPTLLHRRQGVPVVLSLIVSGLALLAASVNLSLRPMIATLLGLLAQYLLVQAWRTRRIPQPLFFVAVALLYLVWANMHLGVVMGFLSLALFAIGDFVDRGSTSTLVRPPRRYLITAFIGFAASLANPYGFGIYTYITRLTLRTGVNAHIAELNPPDPSDPGFVIAALLMLVFLSTLYRNRGRYSARDALHVVAFAVLTVFAARFVVWAALFYALVVPTGLWHTLGSYPMPLGRAGERGLCGAFVLGSLLILVSVASLGSPVAIQACQPLRGAIAYVVAHYPANTRWLSDGGAGSCTLRYAPHRRVFGDTRFDMYPAVFDRHWFNALFDAHGWRAFFQHWHIRVILLSSHNVLVPKLRAQPGFAVVYQDFGADVFVRRPLITAFDSG